MISNKTKPLIFELNSIKNKYNGILEQDLTLEINEYGKDSVEVKLINKNYQQQKTSLNKHLIFLILTINIYGSLLLFWNYHLVICDILFLLWFMSSIWRMWNLTEFEKIIFCSGFGIHFQIHKRLGNQNRFIRYCYIHDVVINEVLENLDFRYFLILRTKGKLFYEKPIVPIFKVFKPPCEGIHLIYKYLNKIVNK